MSGHEYFGGMLIPFNFFFEEEAEGEVVAVEGGEVELRNEEEV